VSKILDRIADAGGILFVILVGVGYIGLVAPHIPQSLASPSAVQTYLIAHPPTVSFWVGAWMEGVGLVALLLLATRLASRLRTVDPAGWLPSAVVGLAVASCTVKLASFAPSLAALHVDRYDARTVTALLDMNDAAFNVSWALDGAFALLLGAGALAARALPRWLAVLGALAGAGVMMGIAVPPVFDGAQPVFLIWLLATSGWLLARGSRRPAIAVPTQVPAIT
jgi:Domain of unknown function (DUF4386)